MDLRAHEGCQKMKIKSIREIDVNNSLNKLKEFFEDERKLQRRFNADQRPFHVRYDDDDEMEEAEVEETEPEEDPAAKARPRKPEKTQDKPKKVTDPVQQEKGPPTPSYDLMREKMNLVRSGKSLKDEGVDIEMREYFESLSDSEKLGLIAYLTGISQIVAGEVSARKVSDPSEAPWKINMARSKRAEERTARQSTKKTGSEQRGTAEAPIVVGEAADKSRELKLIKASSK